MSTITSDIKQVKIYNMFYFMLNVTNGYYGTVEMFIMVSLSRLCRIWHFIEINYGTGLLNIMMKEYVYLCLQ